MLVLHINTYSTWVEGGVLVLHINTYSTYEGGGWSVGITH